MTIIEPNKNKFKLSILTSFIIGLIIFEAVLSIFAYNQNVRLTHALSLSQKSLGDFQAQNADLKNKLYTILDFKNADQLAEKLGLIKERKPEYLALH